MLEAIEMKCRTQRGMMRAWPDGVCRAEGLCALVTLGRQCAPGGAGA